MRCMSSWARSPMPTAVASSAVLLAAMALAGCGGCGADPSGVAPSAGPSAAGSSPAASASPSSSPTGAKEPKPPWIGVDGPVAPLQRILDPKTQGPYNGPTASLHGKITMKGDAPPPTTLTFPDKCPLADSVYGKLFRVAKDGALADVLVAVTGYEGFIPAKSDHVEVTIRGCAFSQRTVALALGQRLDVRNVDGTQSYTPFLDGSEYSALRVAVPNATNAVPLSTRKPGQYLLRDGMDRPFMLADVLVLKYATTAVTKVDGTYEISGLPVGKVRVDALLPVIRKTNGKDIELKEGDNTLDLELTYDAKKDKPVPVPAPEFGTRTVPTVGPPTATPAPSAAP